MSEANKPEIPKRKLKLYEWAVLGLGGLAVIYGYVSTQTPTTAPAPSYTQETTTPAESRPLNGRCDSVLRYMDRAVVALGTYGDTATLGDVVESLKENGETLSQGFNSSDFTSQEDLAMVVGAGQDLLKMRVALLGDSDIKAPSDRFLKAYERVKTICGK